jgi:hypothetical protein
VLEDDREGRDRNVLVNTAEHRKTSFDDGGALAKASLPIASTARHRRVDGLRGTAAGTPRPRTVPTSVPVNVDESGVPPQQRHAERRGILRVAPARGLVDQSAQFVGDR